MFGKIVFWLIVLGLLGLGYLFSPGLQKMHLATLLQPESTKSSGRFQQLPGLNNPYPRMVAIVAPPNGAVEASLYARKLLNDLQQENISAQIVNTVPITVTTPIDRADTEAILSKEPPPIVIINGRVKGRPTLDEVYYELNKQNMMPTPPADKRLAQ